MHCVDPGESFPTRIYLQKSASIQLRTSPSKFGRNYSILFIRVLTGEAADDAEAAEAAEAEEAEETAESKQPPVAKAPEEWYMRCRGCRSPLFYDTHVQQLDEHSCFVDPALQWMGDVSAERGKLACPKCRSKLGNWSWHGLAGPRGCWVAPAFQIHRKQLDQIAV